MKAPLSAASGVRHARWSILFSALRTLHPGDWLTFAAAALLTAVSFPLFWQSSTATGAEVRQGSALVARLDLAQNRRLAVAGPLGTTWIEVEAGRARVSADPGPRQYCVRQGWLSRPGSIAICAPNEVSLRIVGAGKSGNGYDTIVY